MDNAAWHTTDKITSKPHLQLAFQPPYSPELNPVEQLWKHIRNNYTHNHYWESLNQLENSLCEVLAKLSHAPDIIIVPDIDNLTIFSSPIKVMSET